MGSEKRNVINTPYDDVFRTLLNDCSKLIIPVINELFEEHYTGNEPVVFSKNEHFLNQQDGEEEKCITDSTFKIMGEKEKRFLCECQSTADSSMLVRIFEYATQIALDEGEIIGDTLWVEIPNSAVLFLRSSRTTPDNMKIGMKTPGGTACFDVPVMKVWQYTIDEIFSKNLLFLIPFYIFSHESQFKEYNKNEEKLNQLIAEYADLVGRLNALLTEGLISAYTRKTIVEMSGKVLESIAQKYDKVREGVKLVMGGKVLEYEAKRIKNEGRQEGRLEQARETAINLSKMGLEYDAIAKAVNLDVALIRKWLAS